MLEEDIWEAFKVEEPRQKLDRRDTKRFGETWRINAVFREDLRAHEDAFVIARIDASQMELVQYALKIGYLLCDTLTYWKGVVKEDPKLPEGYFMRSVEHKDLWQIDILARKAFWNYPSHYFNDPRTKAYCADIYSEWSQATEHGVVIEKNGKVVAWGAFSPPCELTLGSVEAKHNGKGLYTAFALACAKWGRERGIETIEISTQVTNLAVQKVWARMGLTPFKTVYTLHRWP